MHFLLFFSTACQKPAVWVSDDGRCLVAMTAGYSQTLVWEASPRQDIFATNSSQLAGTWSSAPMVGWEGVVLPGRASFDAVCHVRFCVKEVGDCWVSLPITRPSVILC